MSSECLFAHARVLAALTILATSAAAQDGWTDEPLVPGQTPIKAVHFEELRARINDLLIGCGGTVFSFTHPTLTVGVTPVRALHVTELRTALDGAYAACGRQRPTYSGPALQAGATAIRAVHITELRAAVTALRDPGATSFTLFGAVRDIRTSGPFLAGATVRLDTGESTTAAPDGHYRFANLTGEVTATAASAHHVPASVQVTMDRNRRVDFALEHTGIPPFQGTVFITPDVVGPADPTSLENVTYTGRGERTILDRRVEEWIPVDAYLFDVRYSGGTLEFQVNPEFGSVDAARAEVDAYAAPIGRMPAALISELTYVTINAGTELFGAAVGGSLHGGVIIHTGQGAEYSRDGFLEEVLFHEAGHVTFDLGHANASGWRTAQDADSVFISEYARDYPDREDLAESILPYFAVRYRPDRLSEADSLAILTAIPNRLIYFDEQELDMSPYTATASLVPVLEPSSFQPRRIWRPFEGPPTP